MLLDELNKNFMFEEDADSGDVSEKDLESEEDLDDTDEDDLDEEDDTEETEEDEM